MEEERCPYCNSDKYDIIDFNQEDLNESEIIYSGPCECLECKKIFYITKWYKLIDTCVQTEEERYGE